MSLGLDEFAAAIGVSLPQDSHLMSAVEQLFSTKLPEGWTQHRSSKGSVYYYHEASDSSQVEDPRVTEGRRRIAGLKRGASQHSAGGVHSAQLSISYCSVSPEEVKDMAQHYGVNPRIEYHLLHLVRAAVLTPLPSAWQECIDSSGRTYFYNSILDQSTRRHPVDSYFMPLINKLRQSGGGGGAYPIMAFEAHSSTDDDSRVWVYYDFRNDTLLSKRPADLPAGFEEQQSNSDAEASICDLTAERDENIMQSAGRGRGVYGGTKGGTSPRSAQIQQFLHQVRQDIDAQVNEYKTQNLSSRILDDAKIAKPSKKTEKPQPMPRELVFYSWWFEEGVRRYLALHYEMKTKVSFGSDDVPILFRFILVQHFPASDCFCFHSSSA
jgi:hypothetical protein